MVPAGTTIGGGGGGGGGAGAAAGGAAAGAAAGAVAAGAGAAAGVEDVAGWLAGGCVAAGSLAGAAAGWDAACSWSVDFLHPENSNPAESSVVTRKSLLRLIKTFLPENGFLNQTTHRRLSLFGEHLHGKLEAGLAGGHVQFRNKGLPNRRFSDDFDGLFRYLSGNGHVKRVG